MPRASHRLIAGSAGSAGTSGSDRYDELAEIVSDPAIRRYARRMAGDLFEDVLQETWYAVAQVCGREPIGNLRGYFYRVMANTSRRMLGQLARHGVPVDDLDSAGGFRCKPPLTVVSAEDDALTHLVARARRDQLRRRREELWTTVPACSPDPARYRAVIFAATEALIAGGDLLEQAELNDWLREAYPEWFDAAAASPATKHQRHCRARKSIRQLFTELGP